MAACCSAAPRLRGNLPDTHLRGRRSTDAMKEDTGLGEKHDLQVGEGVPSRSRSSARRSSTGYARSSKTCALTLERQSMAWTTRCASRTSARRTWRRLSHLSHGDGKQISERSCVGSRCLLQCAWLATGRPATGLLCRCSQRNQGEIRKTYFCLLVCPHSRRSSTKLSFF